MPVIACSARPGILPLHYLYFFFFFFFEKKLIISLPSLGIEPSTSRMQDVFGNHSTKYSIAITCISSPQIFLCMYVI